MTTEFDDNELKRAEEKIHKERGKISKSNSSLEFVNSFGILTKKPPRIGVNFFLSN